MESRSRDRWGLLTWLLAALLPLAGLLAWTYPTQCGGVSRYCGCLNPPQQTSGQDYWIRMTSLQSDLARELGRRDGRVYFMNTSSHHACRHVYWAPEAEVSALAGPSLKDQALMLALYLSPEKAAAPAAPGSASLFQLLTDYRPERGLTPQAWVGAHSFGTLDTEAQQSLVKRLELHFRRVPRPIPICSTRPLPMPWRATGSPPACAKSCSGCSGASCSL